MTGNGSGRKVGVLAIIVLTAFLGPFGGNMILPMFAPLKEDLHVGILLLGASITVYMIPFSIVQLFSGVISDVFLGRRVIVAGGLLLYGAGGLLTGASQNVWMFLLARAVQGVGNALTLPIIMALVGDLFRVEVRGRIMGLVSIATTLGVTLGPIFGGLISGISWRFGFLAVAAIAMALAVPSFKLIPARAGSREGRGLEGALTVLRANLTAFSVLALGLLGFILFFTRISVFTYLSEVLSLPPYQLGEERIGMYLSLAGLGGILAGPVSGYLTDRVGRRPTAIIGLLLLAPVFMVYSTGSWFSVLPYLLFAQGFLATTAFTSVNTLVVEVNPEHRATVTSIYGSMRFLGYAVGPMASYPVYLYSSLAGVAVASSILTLIGVAVLLKVEGRPRGRQT